MSSSRNLLGIAIAVAFVTGFAQGTRTLLPAYLASTGTTAESLGAIVSASAVLFLLLDPFVVFALGYLWGKKADVPATYPRFGAGLFVAALVGFGIGYVAIFLSISNMAGTNVTRVVTVSTARGIETAGNVALAALAGSAIAHFRGRRRSDPT